MGPFASSEPGADFTRMYPFAGRILMGPACPGVGGDKPVAARSLITGEHCGERRLVRVRIDGIAVP